MNPQPMAEEALETYTQLKPAEAEGVADVGLSEEKVQRRKSKPKIQHKIIRYYNRTPAPLKIDQTDFQRH